MTTCRYSKSLSPRRRGAKDSANNSRLPFYGEGDVLTLMSVLLSVFVEVAGDGFTIVVLLYFFSAGGFVTVVSFCSQAARSAAPIKRQMYLFMKVLDGLGDRLFKVLAKDSWSWWWWFR